MVSLHLRKPIQEKNVFAFSKNVLCLLNDIVYIRARTYTHTHIYIYIYIYICINVNININD